MRLKIIYLLLLIIIFTGFVYPTTSVKINGSDFEYTNDLSDEFNFEVILDDDCNLGDLIQVNISTEYSGIDFDLDVSCNSSGEFKKNFYLNTTANNPSIPNILVNKISGGEYDGFVYDEVTIEYNSFLSKLYVNNTPVSIGTFKVNSVDSFYNDFYKGEINLYDVENYGIGYSSGFENFFVYIVESSKLNNFKTQYSKRDIIDNIEIYNEIIDTNLVDDGNYYILLDYEDKAGNFGKEEDVINSKVILKIDNTPPAITTFNLFSLDLFESESVFYVNSDTDELLIEFEDEGVGIDPDGVIFLERNGSSLVDVDISDSVGSFEFDFNSVPFTIEGDYKISIVDYLENIYEKEFEILIDNTPPPAPSSVTVTRAINNDMTITWTWVEGDYVGSDLKEYKIYRHDSNFSDVTDKTLVCTVSAENTKTCTDTSSKSNNKTYYYGVVAIDKAGNISDVLTGSAKTGPSLSVDMDFDYSTYVKSTTPKIELSFSSNVSDVRFSCNGTTFSAWREVSGTSQDITNFNVTSGNGCTTEQGSRTLYVEARDEDDNTLITRTSFDFRLDTQAPTVPTPTAVQQTDGGIKVSWSASSDSGSGVLEYFVYYSETSSVSESSQSHRTSSTQFIYKPNLDQKFYFRVLAVDRVGNKSALSTTVSADSKRYGPSYVFDVVPKNIVDDVIYLKRGVSNFTITSDENLKETPVIRMKRDSQSFQTLTNINYNNKITTFTYDFETSGEYILEIVGTNNSNQSTIETFEFTVDAQVPSFDVNYSFDEDTKRYTFLLEDGFSEDIFRVEYLLNNTETICFLVDSDDNYECVLNTLDYEDGEYKVHVYGYDIALNYFSKIIDIEIDNIDQDLIERENLIKEVNKNKQIIETRFAFLEIINRSVSEDILNDFDLAKDKILQANDLFNEDNISQSNDLYNSANNLLLEIISKIPEETEVKSKTFVIDLDNLDYNLNTYILDANIIQDTLSFYQEEVLEVSREFKVFEISGENYYSSTLFFENKSDEDIVISFVEFIPTDFARRARDVYFDREVVILRENPVILYDLTVPKNSTVSTRYIRTTPITNLDILANFDRVVYKDPILIYGSIGSEDIDMKSALVDTRTILFISIALLIFIVIILVVSLIFSANKKKNKAVSNLGSKDEINKYLGSSKVDYKKENITLNEALYEEKKSDIEEKNKHDSNYDFILNAVKNKKN